MYQPNEYHEAGQYCIRLENWQLAVHPLTEAIRLGVDTASCHTALGKALLHSGKVEDSVSHLERALALNPNESEARAELVGAHFLLEDLNKAWEMDAKFRESVRSTYLDGARHPALSGPFWNGESLDGKSVLAYMHDGYGDLIQNVRYFHALKEAYDCHTVLLCTPELHRLLGSCEAIDEFYSDGCHVDFRTNHWDLAAHFKEIPDYVPYLSAKPRCVESWRDVIGEGDGFKVGIAWHSGRGWFCRTKSAPLNLFEPLSKVDGVKLFSLQVRAGTEQLAGAKFPVADLGTRFDTKSFDDVAAAIANMDLIISVDTSIAHLAGAMGKQVWTLLPYVPASRWKLTGEAAAMYPTMRLFRQPHYGDWNGVFSSVFTELGSLVSSQLCC